MEGCHGNCGLPVDIETQGASAIELPVWASASTWIDQLCLHLAVTVSLGPNRIGTRTNSGRQRSAAVNMTSKAEPLSIESLLQKQRAEKEAASKVNNSSVTTSSKLTG